MVNTLIRKILILLLVAGTTGITKLEAASAKAPVDYVNPYMGNISHLLVPTYPIVHLPNNKISILRIKVFTISITSVKKMIP